MPNSVPPTRATLRLTVRRATLLSNAMLRYRVESPAPAQTILTAAAGYRLRWFLIEGGHKIGHSVFGGVNTCLRLPSSGRKTFAP